MTLFNSNSESSIYPAITINNLKKMNLRNGRFKMQESLFGAMLNHNNALSRPRSDCGGNRSKLKFFKHTDAFVRINLMSPALSICGQSIDRNQNDEKDNEFYDVLSGYLSDSANPNIIKNSEINQYQNNCQPVEASIDLVSENAS